MIQWQGNRTPEQPTFCVTTKYREGWGSWGRDEKVQAEGLLKQMLRGGDIPLVGKRERRAFVRAPRRCERKVNRKASQGLEITS